jgi:hypothetical protein
MAEAIGLISAALSLAQHAFELFRDIRDRYPKPRGFTSCLLGKMLRKREKTPLHRYREVQDQMGKLEKLLFSMEEELGKTHIDKGSDQSKALVKTKNMTAMKRRGFLNLFSAGHSRHVAEG